MNSRNQNAKAITISKILKGSWKRKKIESNHQCQVNYAFGNSMKKLTQVSKKKRENTQNSTRKSKDHVDGPTLFSGIYEIKTLKASNQYHNHYSWALG
jgi:hypothetical protein